MTDYQPEETYRRNDTGFSSLGVENKYYKDGYWYKQDISGYEGLAEEACSMLLRHSNLAHSRNEEIHYITYEACLVNGRSGCRSKSFLRENESVLTFRRLYEVACGGDLTNRIYEIRDTEERIRFVIDFIQEYTGTDCTEYLQNILSFDMLTLNIDRHFHNLALIQTEDGYRTCPIFDNGAAFLSNFSIFPPDEEIESLISHAAARPFSGSFEQQAIVLGTRIELDYQEIFEEVQHIKHPRLKKILEYQLKRYRTFFRNCGRT